MMDESGHIFVSLTGKKFFGQSRRESGYDEHVGAILGSIYHEGDFELPQYHVGHLGMVLWSFRNDL